MLHFHNFFLLHGKIICLLAIFVTILCGHFNMQIDVNAVRWSVWKESE